jgi:hypothetical protein
MLRPTLAALAGAAALTATGAAHGAIIIYAANLSGPNESPPNASPGIGSARVTIDNVAQTMRVQVNFSGLLGGVTASHIHCCTAAANAGVAGVATTTPTFTGFPSGVTSGTYDNTFDLTQATSYNPAFVSAQGGLASAEAALLAGMAANKTYLNIHTSVVPGGEIRGFLAAIPEPGTWALMIAGLGLVGATLRRRRATAIPA